MPKKRKKKPSQKGHTTGDATPPSESTHPKDPAEIVEARRQYLKLQVLAMARAAKPLEVKFSFRTTDSVLAFLETTADLAFKKEIDGRLLGALNGAAGVAVRILQPPQPVNITQTQSFVMDEAAIRAMADKLKNKPEAEREVIVNAIAELAKSEVSGGSG